MTSTIQSPIKGQPMRASWGAAVSSAVNSLLPMGSDGLLARQGVAGSGFSPLPANKRDRRAVAASSPLPFELRAKVETRKNGDVTEQRLVVDFYCMDVDMDVVYSQFPIGPRQQVGSTAITSGWNNLYTSEWAEELETEDIDYYVNVYIGAEHQEDESIRELDPNNTFWIVSETPVQTYHKTEGNYSTFRFGYLIGNVSAGSNCVTVTQYYKGAMHFLDLVAAKIGGSGSEDDVDGTNYPMPFQYKKTVADDDDGQMVTTWAIVHNVFYWDGALVTLDDYTPSATCTVYLTCVLPAPSQSGGDPEWEFEIAEQAAVAPSGGKAVNYKLYDFVNHKITLDYRTTFLELNSPRAEAAVDDVSIEEHNAGTEGEPEPQHAIKGWHDQDASESKLGDLLTGDSEDESRQVVVRNGKAGAIEYLPLGKVSAAVDDISVEEHNAGTDEDPEPQHAIKGWHDDTTSDTTLADLLTGESPDVGRHLLVRNGGPGGGTEFLPTGVPKTLTIKGADGEDDIVVRIVASDNIVIGPLSGTVSYLADMRYNTQYHRFEKLVANLDRATGVITYGSGVVKHEEPDDAWETMENGTCTPVSDYFQTL